MSGAPEVRLPKFTDHSGAARLIQSLGEAFAVVQNPSYIFPPYEIYPLPPKTEWLEDGLEAVLLDMDGTLTSTEPLCLHALDTVVRRASGNAENPAWPGLNPERDYPHIIGNSVTRHVEYLLDTYQAQLDDAAFARHFFDGVAWSLTHIQDAQRLGEIRVTLEALGLAGLDAEVLARAAQQPPDGTGPRIDLTIHANRTRAGIEIYYHRWYEILLRIDRGEGPTIARDILKAEGAHAVELMPGAGIFLAITRGLLGAQAEVFAEELSDHCARHGLEPPPIDMARRQLAALGRHFVEQPCRLAVVTAATGFEADICLREGFCRIRERVTDWPLPASERERLLEAFGDYRAFFCGVFTASEIIEWRLKPHRDLYSLALHQLGLMPEAFHRVVGFEDSESGTIAMRAAGIPLVVGVPLEQGSSQEFQAASHTLHAGLPEALLRYNLFLP